MKLILSLVGLFFVIIGLITVFLPIPIGILSLLIGIAILISVSPRVRDMVKWLRKRWAPADYVFRKAEPLLPDPIAKPLHETDPDDDENDEATDEETGEDPSEEAMKGRHIPFLAQRKDKYIPRASAPPPPPRRVRPRY